MIGWILYCYCTLYLRVGGDDTLVAGDEVDLTQATAREQRRRGEVGTAGAPLRDEITRQRVGRAQTWSARTLGTGRRTDIVLTYSSPSPTVERFADAMVTDIEQLSINSMDIIFREFDMLSEM